MKRFSHGNFLENYAKIKFAKQCNSRLKSILRTLGSINKAFCFCNEYKTNFKLLLKLFAPSVSHEISPAQKTNEYKM